MIVKITKNVYGMFDIHVAGVHVMSAPKLDSYRCAKAIAFDWEEDCKSRNVAFERIVTYGNEEELEILILEQA